MEKSMPYIEHKTLRILFIHIPKTGGTSVERWMRNFGNLRFSNASARHLFYSSPQHFTYEQMEKLFGKNYFDFSFAFVRHPIRRFESEFKMRWAGSRRREEPDFEKKYGNFSVWVEQILAAHKKNKYINDNHIRPQSDFISNKVVIYKLESGMMENLSDVEKRCGLPDKNKALHARNSAKTKSVEWNETIEWNEQLRKSVVDLYAEDFKQFGYDPNE